MPSILASPSDDIVLIRDWIVDCTSGHNACAAAIPRTRFLPKRLLKLNAFRSHRDLKLIHSRDLIDPSNVSYTTLSHCWGKIDSAQGPSRLLLSNLERRQKHIRYDDLSATFQDAIRITRGLGIDYLWIDSLCIIQDSRADWEEEAIMMAQIYASSYCTLAASSSQNSMEGCARDIQRTGIACAPRYIDIEKDEYLVRIFETSPLDWNKELQRGPLMTRAWTLQERELSLRIVHFSRNLLLWECRTMKASSELPWFQMKHEDPPASLLLNNAADLVDNSETLQRREYWFRMVEDYSNRNLTVETDKLPALAGLAQRENTVRKSSYIAGLWAEDLPSALLWRFSSWSARESIDANATTRPAEYLAPSWSWASVNGPISYDSQRSTQSSLSDITERQSEIMYQEFCILEMTPNDVSYGTTLAATKYRMHVQGCIRPATVSLANVVGEQLLLQLSNGTKAGILCPDSVAEVAKLQTICCLRVRDEIHHSRVEVPYGLYDHLCEERETLQQMIMGLALVRVLGHADTYQRIGLIRFMKKSFFDGIAMTRLVII
jgi:hypothetical protein